jgi:hypothetical protein
VFEPPEYEPPDYEPPDYEEHQEPEEPGGFIHWPRDPQLDLATESLTKRFNDQPGAVFYGRQLEVMEERKHFHWITHKALKEMTREGSVLTEKVVTPENNNLRLYWSRRNRYPKRAMRRLIEMVDEHAHPEITRALGRHAETLFGLALAHQGFALVGKETRSFRGKRWVATEHDLDWICERDGVAWGVEIKNTWAYIPKDEMEVKIALCRHLGVRPLFIMRWAPKSYIFQIREGGGFGLLYETQFFPFGSDSRMEKARLLSLPVDSPANVPEATMKRFVNWHVSSLRL